MVTETCEARALTTGEPCCSRRATHLHQIRDEDGEVYEEMYICDKHARECAACRPLQRQGEAKEGVEK